MQQDSFEKQMSMTNKRDKIFNVRKVHYKQFDHQKYLKPTYTPFLIKDHTQQPFGPKDKIQEPLTSKISKKGGQYHYQVAIISSPVYKQLTKKYNSLKEEYGKEKQRRLEQLRLREEQLCKCKAEKERIDSQRIKIIQRRDQLRSKISEIRERNEVLRNEQMQRREEYRIMNMEYLRNMIIGMKYQNGMDIDPDTMTYEQLLELGDQIGSVSKGLTEEQIKNLKKKVYSQSEPQQLCSVCYYNAKQGEQMTILPCNHSFHTECIKEWLVKEKMCPMCKQQIITKIQSSKKLIVTEKQLQNETKSDKCSSQGQIQPQQQEENAEERAQEELLEVS